MSRLKLIMALLVPAAGTAVLADGLPGTMNFRNQTASRVNQTTAEQNDNEKHVEVGDFDEDGDLDVVIAVAYSDFGAHRNKVYRNDAGVMNEDASIVPGFGSNKVSRVAFLRDFDMDGHLDIWIINDSNSNLDQMFTGDWTGGVFNDFDEVFNRVVSGGTMSTGAACSGWAADFDQNGFPDVYCGNYPNSAQDRLLSNNGTGFFADLTSTHVVSSGDYVVDVNGADMNGDGYLDLVVSEHGGSQNRIYYNNNLEAGSGIGDFKYTGSQQNIGNPSANENSMDAADFDGDGDQDIYASNAVGATGDRILLNNGLTVSNQAFLQTIDILPPSVTGVVSRKVEVADLNDDGRIDAFVTKGNFNGRPTVLRNVTVNGNMEFVDWSPAPAFPISNSLTGWNAAVFDTNLDGDLDIFLGGWSDEHLIEAVESTEYLEADLVNDIVPGIYDKSPAAVVGESGPSSPDLFIHSGMNSGGFISVVINGADDYLLELLDGSDVVLATIDRGGVGTEEATQYGTPTILPTTVKVRVTAQACANAYNVSGDCGVGIVDFLDLLAAWGPNPGHPADYDGDDFVGITDFLALLANWGDSPYIVEFLARSG